MRALSLFVICICLCLSSKVAAQEQTFFGADASRYFPNAKTVRVNASMNLLSYVAFEEGAQPTLDTFIERLKEQLQLNKDYNFELVSNRTDRLGITHLKYKQFFKETELAYTNLAIHTKQGKVISFNGEFYSKTPIEFTEGISEDKALEIAYNEIGALEYFSGSNSPKVKKAYLPLNSIEKGNDVLPVFTVNLYAKEPLSRTLLFVNANTGAIEFQESLIHSGGDLIGTAVTAYSDTQIVITDSLAGVYRLVDSTRGNGVETYNCQQTRNQDSAVHFLDSNNFWNNFNPLLDEYATDAHWGTERAYDYLEEIHDYNSIDDSGFTLRSYVHYDVNLVNAFWDGERMTYGDGNATTSPLTTLDIVGHEVAHGLTEFSSDLIYANESGAINEAFSDIFGTALEFYARPNRANWLIGEDIGRSIRSMENPNDNGDPDTYEGTFWVDQNCIPTRLNDRCGVHSNSGVMNYWFYLLSEGGMDENDNLDSFDVSGLGLGIAEEIAFRTLTVYLSPSSDFEDARFFSILSAIDLHGPCSPEVESVTNAWYAVGVGEEYIGGVSADFDALLDTNFCFFPVDIKFESITNNAFELKWLFGEDDSSFMVDPVYTFQDQGEYTVTLIANGLTCGSDTMVKTNYITIDTNLACAYYITDSIRQETSECSGRMFDAGGATNNYENDKTSLFTISVPSADFIELSFDDVSLEESFGFSCNRDYIQIYDGDSTDARILGRYCSEHLPPAILNSTSNSVTIMLFADEMVNDEGFLLNWQCKTSIDVPSTDFIALVDTSCDGVVPFHNQTRGGATSFRWEFGDGNFSLEANPTHQYINEGTYDVTLIASNSMGSDTLIKVAEVVIDRPEFPSVENDTVCLNGEGMLFVANPIGSVEWYSDISQNPVNTNDAILLNNVLQDTTFFVRQVVEGNSFKASFSDKMGAGEFSNDNDYLSFDVHEPILIEKITLNSNLRGQRMLEIRNNKGEIIASTIVSLAGRRASSNVDIQLYPDTAYRMSMSHRENGLFKNTAGASFPYDIGGLVTITGSNLPNTHFPYFYQWEISRLSCESEFAQASIVVDTNCIVTAVPENDLINLVSVYPNPVESKITIEGIGALNLTSIQLISAIGQELITYDTGDLDLNENQLQVDVSNLMSGVYYLRLQTKETNKTFKILKVE